MELTADPPAVEGPSDWFTGDVWIVPIARGREGSGLNVAAVHFAPGARTAWHAHGRGQTLYVMDGHGLVQSRGEPVVAMRPGDVIDTPAGEWHWHGAAPNHLMAHLSITEGDAEWGDHVTDDEYPEAAGPDR